MDFKTFIKTAWQIHEEHPRQILDDIAQQLEGLQDSSEIAQVIQLVTHICGEHLGDFARGIEMLQTIKTLEANDQESHALIQRCSDMFGFINGDVDSIDNYVGKDRVKILSNTALMLLQKADVDVADRQRASSYLRQAVDVFVDEKIDDESTVKALAINGNNIACTLEDMPERTTDENTFMIFAAQTARTYWEQAGTWLETERAEYRLAMTHLKAGDAETAMKHARLCLEISESNKASPLEILYANEAIAVIAQKLGQQDDCHAAIEAAEAAFNTLEEDGKNWCQPTLDELRALKN